MLIFPDRGAILAALNEPLPADLQTLLNNIVDQAAQADLLDLTYVVVIGNDSERAIADEIGFSPVTNPIDGLRFDEPGFEPYWAHLQRRGGWYELIHPVSNDGFAFVLLIDARADSDLVRMCHRFTTVPL